MKITVLPLAILFPFAVSAQTPPDAAATRANAQQQQQIQQQRESQQREATVTAPGVRSTEPASAGWPSLPTETPCFSLHTLTLQVPQTLPAATQAAGASSLPQDRFVFAQEWLNHYQGQCVGQRGLDVLSKGLQAEILSQGYVTTRVMLPSQDLASGGLIIALIPGMIRHIRFADESTRGFWQTAFPNRDGDVLQLRDLEQGLESSYYRIPRQWPTPAESTLTMTYVHHAVVNETCPVCGQGRVLVASEKDGHSLFVLCEDCESEWNAPSESYDSSVASRDRHTFSRYLETDELVDHPWYSQVLNR